MDTSTLEMNKAPLKINVINHGVCMHAYTLPLISEFSNDMKDHNDELSHYYMQEKCG